MLDNFPGSEVVSVGHQLEIIKQVGSPAALERAYTISARLGSVNSSPASAQACSISVPAVVRAIAVPAPDPVPGLADMRANKIAVGVSAGSAGTLHEA